MGGSHILTPIVDGRLNQFDFDFRRPAKGRVEAWRIRTGDTVEPQREVYFFFRNPNFLVWLPRSRKESKTEESCCMLCLSE